jgi:hypothetical protein
MVTIARFIVGLTAVAGLVGCDGEHTIDVPPGATGHASVRDKDGRWQEVALTQAQLLKVSRWMDAHRAGWRALTETPPLSTFSITLESADGRKYAIQLFVQTTSSGAAYMYAYEPKPELPLKHSLSGEEIRELRTALGM